MKKDEAKNRIDLLKKEIEKHNNNYYVLNKPSISDFEIIPPYEKFFLCLFL